MLQDDKATMSNTEALGRQYITFTLRPWLENWQQEISLSLLGPSESRDFYPVFDLADFTAADTLARFQAYVAAVTNGIMNPNEAREHEPTGV